MSGNVSGWLKSRTCWQRAMPQGDECQGFDCLGEGCDPVARSKCPESDAGEQQLIASVPDGDDAAVGVL